MYMYIICIHIMYPEVSTVFTVIFSHPLPLYNQLNVTLLTEYPYTFF